MTITRITRAKKERHFGVYDLEWNPDTMVPRLFGFYDGSHYRAYKSVNAFMEAILRPQYKGWWFFAHAGGLADVPFLLQWMADHTDYQVMARFSGSAAVMVEISKKIKTRRRGKTVWKKGPSWTLVDSFFLLRTRLRNIGKWLGEGSEKGGAEGDTSIFYAPWSELRVYNEQDCRILHRGIQVFQDQLEVLGGELMPTIASTAMRLFRREYLRGDIRTTAGVNTRLRESYIASRVEVFKKKITDAHQYDINSSFPFSMTQPVPGELMFVSDHLPEKESECFFAEVEVTVPEMDIPPLPFRQHNKIYFPTGTWNGWLSGVDIRFLMARGGRVEKVREVFVYEQRDDLAQYVNDLYERRRVATTDFEKVVYKFLLNSLYGKFGERTEKTTVMINPVSSNLLIPKYNAAGQCVRRGERLFPGAILITEDRPIAHEHVPIASHVTANSRRLISNILYDAQAQCGDIPAYTDTDCVVTRAVLKCSDKLGDLKLERDIKVGEFFAPKFYRIDGHVKAKGFSGITSDGFQLLVDGYAGQFERQARPREMLRRCDLTPRRLHIPKQLRFRVEDEKRVFSKDGDSSRPYTVKEIMSRKDKG